MKKVLAVLLLTLAAVPAMAQHWHGHGIRHGHRGHYYGGGGWVAPLIIGGVVGAAIANSRETVVVQPQPSVAVQNPPVYVQRQTVFTDWKEIQNSNRAMYRERSSAEVVVL